MDVNKLCPNCMNEAKGDICSHCGYDRSKGQDNAHALRPLTILSGKYIIGNVIGEGGFGITYIGFDLNLEMKIAVKEFYPNGFVTRESSVTSTVTEYTTNDSAQYQKWKDSFVKEARNLAKFSNLPGIVHVRDFFQENNTAYIIMEYVEGETLKSHLKKRMSPVSVGETLEMMKPVIKSLSKVHAAGIIHRDISPDNIMIQSGGDVKLIDFGAAREFESGNEKSMSVLLKPGYAPEEQYRTRGEQGPWTDVYALSATIYRCITGVKPVESMERMRVDELKKPSAMGINISPETEAVILKGMSVYAENRIRSMDELYRELYGETLAGAGTQYQASQSAATTANVSSGNAAGDNTKTSGTTGSGGVSHTNNKNLIIGLGAAAAVLVLFIIIFTVIGRNGSVNSGKESSLDTGAASVPSEENQDIEETEEDSTEEKKTKKKKDKEDKKGNTAEDTGVHSYDFVTADVTWKDAYEESKKKGGYLCHINSDEEAEHIINEIRSKGMENITFFIGGRRDKRSRDYYWIDADGNNVGDPINNNPAYEKYWLPGEPSYEDENGQEEKYLDMLYRKSDNRWYFNDVPKDIIAVSNYYAGKTGYIVEYGDESTGEATESTGNTKKELQDKLDTLYSKYGKLKSPQSGHLPDLSGELGYNTVNIDKWLDPDGIVYGGIRDFDDDGDDELIVVRTDRSRTHMDCWGVENIPLILEMYENTGGSVKETDEILFAPYSRFDAEPLEPYLGGNMITDVCYVMSLSEINNEKVLLCEEYASNHFVDGLDQNYWGIRYDGNEFSYVLSFSQTEPMDSSYFSYIGFEFSNGELSDYNLLYDDRYYEYPDDYDYKPIYQDDDPVKEFFENYRIKLKKDYSFFGSFNTHSSIFNDSSIEEQLFILNNYGSDTDINGADFRMEVRTED